MLSTQHSNKSVNLLKKINSVTLLSTIFSYVSQKTSIKILQINKKLSSLLNLNVADCYLDKMYQEIILESKGDLNNIFLQSYTVYQQSSNFKEINQKSLTFKQLISNMIKYINYLYSKKEFKTLVLSIDSNVFTNWMNFTFIIEVIRNIKYGLSIKLNSPINYRYYDIIKDAIHNLKEINTIYLFTFKITEHNEKYLKDYLNFCDWTKVKCINFAESHPVFEKYERNKNKQIFIPDDAPFRKIVINEKNYFSTRKLYDLISAHGSHIEHCKIYNFYDGYLYERGDNKLEKDYFEKMANLKKIKFINSRHLFFFTFLIFMNKNLSNIKVLTLDNISEYDNDCLDFMKKNYEQIIENLNKLNNLEKLEINFNYSYIASHAFQILSTIVKNNKNIKELKIKFIPKEKDKENSGKHKDSGTRKFLENFINYNSEDKKEEEIKEFTKLIKAISSLSKLYYLQLAIPMDNRMTTAFNNYFNLGENLNYLNIMHSCKLDLCKLLNTHPNLNKIDFSLVKDGLENPINKFKYEFGQRSWKSITLNDYPINNTFIEALIKCKGSLTQLTLKDSVNVSEKSDVEVNNILLDIKNKLNN
jgi:hypothetical protein